MLRSNSGLTSASSRCVLACLERGDALTEVAARHGVAASELERQVEAANSLALQRVGAFRWTLERAPAAPVKTDVRVVGIHGQGRAHRRIVRSARRRSSGARGDPDPPDPPDVAAGVAR